jgi:hypothetical protein
MSGWRKSLPFLTSLGTLALACAFIVLAPLTQVGAVTVPSRPGAQASSPRKINVGLYIINLEQLNVQNGNYTVEFYLNFKCEGSCDDVQFRMLSGKYAILDKDEEKSGSTGWLVYQIRADLNENLDFSDYPFDTQLLRIRIESDSKTTDEEVYVADSTLSDLDPDLALAGWVVERNFQTEVVDYRYSVYDSAYSRYIFTIPVYRPPLYGVLKALLPATIIMLSGLLAYLFNYDTAGNSIAVVTASLAGSVLFNINLTSSLPAAGHLTIADLFMIVNYIALVTTLTAMISVYVLKERGHVERAKRLFSTARRFVPAGWVIAQAAMLFYALVLRGVT